MAPAEFSNGNSTKTRNLPSSRPRLNRAGQPLELGFVRPGPWTYNPATVIDAALKFLTDQINAQLLRRTGTSLGEAELGPLVDDKGAWVQPVNSLRLALFQIDEERSLREQMPSHVLVGGREVVMPPPLKLNLVIVLAARFQQYDQALRTLSLALNYFQSHPLFTPTDSPGLPAGLDRLTVELQSYGPEQLNQMWTCFGAKHLPAIIYRLRMVVLQDDEPTGTGQPITTIDTVLHGR